MKKKLILISGIIIILTPILLFYFLHFFFGKDLEPINDSDLLLGAINIPDEENAYIELKKILSFNFYSTASSSSELLEEESLDYPQIKELIDENQAVFKILKDFNEKKNYQSPDLANPKNASWWDAQTSYNPMRNAIRILALKSLYELKAGNDLESYKDAKMILDIGRKIEDSQCTDLEYLNGVSFEKLGIETLIKIVNSTNSYNLLNNIKKDLNDYKSIVNKSLFKEHYVKHKNDLNRDNFIDDFTLLGEKSYFFNTFVRVLYSNNFYYKKNETLSIIANNVKFNINDYRKDCSEERSNFETENVTLSKVFFLSNSNSIGKMFEAASVINLTSIRQKRCDNDKLYNDLMEAINSRL